MGSGGPDEVKEGSRPVGGNGAGTPGVRHAAKLGPPGGAVDRATDPSVPAGAPVESHRLVRQRVRTDGLGVLRRGVTWGADLEDVGTSDPALQRQRRLVRLTVDTVVVASCVAFVLWQLHPSLLLSDTTPAGGDMGAHVWGPAYLRDQLLPHFQIAGWTPDWYAGSPVYQFYMVLPSLVIVALGAGLHGLAALLPAAAGAALVAVAITRRHDRRARNAAIVGAVIAGALVGLPYGVAFKLVSVSGVLTLPIAAYAFGRLGGFRFPTPAVLAAATLPFLFYRGFTIYGGNIASTLAGEFAFSMALSLAVVYLGMVLRGLETGRHRGWCAVVLALTGLCHLIVAFWALGATVLIVMTRLNRSRFSWDPCVALIAGGLALLLNAWLFGPLLGLFGGLPVLVLAGLGVVAVAVGSWLLSESVRWLTPMLVVGGLLSAFWVGPFFLRRAYLNDMGWEKLPYPNQPDGQKQGIWDFLLPSESPDIDLRWAFGLAILGGLVCLLVRKRAGIVLLLSTVTVGVAFVVMPEGRLWNGRLLPFYYLSMLLLAGIAVAETARLVMRFVRAGRPPPASAVAGVPTALAALVAALVTVGLPLGALPFDARAGAGFDWPGSGPLRLHAEPESFVPSWARWNYSGYEGKASYREYYQIVHTMQDVGRDHGCGRAFWEYEKELDRYGTPMALMLLPHWTDGCIGSMEGLYFEASATTPFHFLTQVELSASPSAAQRDLPYGTFDIDRGVDHLQMLGVRYYMATSDQAITAARQHPDLTEVASSGPWVVFQVADSPLVEPLTNEPAVLENVDDTQREWLEEPRVRQGDQAQFGGPAVRWFTDATQWSVPLTNRGPDDWQRIRRGEVPEARPVDPVEVSNIDAGSESLSFDVDRVGTPVLVKTSYFPNWRVSGAEGPYRVTPNLMVVVPTDTHVELTYGRTWVEYVSYTLTLLGIAGLVLLARRRTYRFTPRPPGSHEPVYALTRPAAARPARALPHGPFIDVDAHPPDDADVQPRGADAEPPGGADAQPGGAGGRASSGADGQPEQQRVARGEAQPPGDGAAAPER